MAETMEHQQLDGPAFYLLTVLWGREFREIFLSVSLPSLLAADNIPVLENMNDSRFVIVTTEEDWVAMQTHPVFELLRSFIEPVHIVMEPPKPTDLKMLVMSAGHKAATEYAFKHRAFGVVTCPDVIYSNGTVAALQRHAYAAADVVLAIGMRFEKEGVIRELHNSGELSLGRPLSLSPRRLVTIALDNLHSESKLFEWDTDYYWETPVVTFWRVPGQKGILACGFSWTPLLVNYGAIRQHVTDVFENWTMDAHYIYDNFGECPSIHVVRDSDELMQVSLTSEDILSYYPLARDWLKNVPILGNVIRIRQLRNFIFSQFTDPLRRRIFNLSVRIHADPLNENWSELEARTRLIIEQACRSPSLRERVTLVLGAFFFPGLLLRLVTRRKIRSVSWCWQYRRFLWQRVKEKVGLVRGRSRLDGRDWVSPAFGLLNPVWSLRVIFRRRLTDPDRLNRTSRKVPEHRG